MTVRQEEIARAVGEAMNRLQATDVERLCILCGAVAALAAANGLPLAEVQSAISTMYASALRGEG